MGSVHIVTWLWPSSCVRQMDTEGSRASLRAISTWGWLAKFNYMWRWTPIVYILNSSSLYWDLRIPHGLSKATRCDVKCAGRRGELQWMQPNIICKFYRSTGPCEHPAKALERLVLLRASQHKLHQPDRKPASASTLLVLPLPGKNYQQREHRSNQVWMCTH